MLKIAVVDDEKIIREQLERLIEKQAKIGKIDCKVDVFGTGEELLATKVYYDVIFLDIQMEGLNGIQTAGQIREREKEFSKSRRGDESGEDMEWVRESTLIFVTAIREYVFDAFDVSAFHYLVKPIDEQKFSRVFEGAVLEAKKRQRQEKHSLFLKTRDRNITLNQDHILYIESRGKKVEVHTSREVIGVYAAMKNLEEQLGKNFYRCHRGYLVNLGYIAEYGSDNITLSNGEEILLAREKYSEFVKVYMRYLRDGGAIRV